MSKDAGEYEPPEGFHGRRWPEWLPRAWMMGYGKSKDMLGKFRVKFVSPATGRSFYNSREWQFAFSHFFEEFSSFLEEFWSFPFFDEFRRFFFIF